MTRVIFIDVDDTVIRSVGTKRIPIPAVFPAYASLKKRAQLYTCGVPAALNIAGPRRLSWKSMIVS